MGCKIKERREFLKMSQEELAEKSAVSRATISSLENNSERNTSTKILKRIASALDRRFMQTRFPVTGTAVASMLLVSAASE